MFLGIYVVSQKMSPDFAILAGRSNKGMLYIRCLDAAPESVVVSPSSTSYAVRSYFYTVNKVILNREKGRF